MSDVKRIVGITVGTTLNPNRYNAHGKSAYEIAVEKGFVGTEQEWLDSLRPVLNPNQFKALRPLAGKKILCLGDELMGNDQVNGVPSYLAEYTGATVYNGGFARSGFARRTNSSANVCFDLPNIIDAMVSGNWSVHETQAESVRNSTPAYSYFPDTVAMLKTIDFSKIDAITLAFGTIDWSDGKNADYVVSELKASIDKIQLNFPEMRILVITPVWRYFTMGSSSSDDYKEYGEGYTLREWAKKIEDAAKEKHISVLNAYENMPLSYNNASTYFDLSSSNADGLHHVNLNEKGNQMYAQIICGKLCSLFASPNPDTYEQSDSNLTIDDSLRFSEDGKLGVNTTGTVEEGNALPVTSDAVAKAGYLKEHQSLEEYAKKSDIPTVPTNISAFENDKGYLTGETDPTVPSWAKEPNRPTYTPDDVGAEAKGTASNLVSAHNTGTEVHSDIRLLIKNLTDRLDAVANSSDKELDQLSEIVAYIKNNKGLIDGITTSKVGVADIIDNLTTNVSNKPLSAAQGVVLKAFIDAITVPTKVSQLENDKGYLTQHQDLSAYAKKTDIPTVPTKLSQLTNDKTFMTKAEIEALIESIVLQGYLGGYRLRVANDSGKTGYLTVKKG